MVTCYLRYVVDPFKLKEFETYGKMWIPLVEKFGGQHHGYFLPHEGANNIRLFFCSLAGMFRLSQRHNNSVNRSPTSYAGGFPPPCSGAGDFKHSNIARSGSPMTS